MNSLYNCRTMWKILHSTKTVRNFRNFSSGKILRDTKPTPEVPKEGAKNGANVLGSFQHKVTNFERWVLVSSKKYPSKDQVPELVTDDVIQKAMSKFRIRIANIMMVITIILCVYTVMVGKIGQKSGQQKAEEARDEFRRQMTEEFRRKVAEESAQK